MDLAAGLKRDGPVAVKFQLVCPAVAIVREAVRPQKQHRINEMARHFRSHQASLADGSNQAATGEPAWRMPRAVIEASLATEIQRGATEEGPRRADARRVCQTGA